MEGNWGILVLLAVAVRCADCAGGHPRSDQPRMSHSAQSVFKAGFRVSARHFGKVMGMLVATGWPFVATIVAQSIGAMRSVSLNTPWISQAFVILSLLLMLLYGGYFLLSMAGLAERLLPEGGSAPRPLAEPPGGNGPREDDLPIESNPAAGDGNFEAPPAGNAPEDGTG